MYKIDRRGKGGGHWSLSRQTQTANFGNVFYYFEFYNSIYLYFPTSELKIKHRFYFHYFYFEALGSEFTSIFCPGQSCELLNFEAIEFMSSSFTEYIPKI